MEKREKERKIDGLPKFMFDIRGFYAWDTAVQMNIGGAQNHYAHVLQHDTRKPSNFSHLSLLWPDLFSMSTKGKFVL